MIAKERNNLVRKTLQFPVRYDGQQQTIWDAKGLMVCDIKGWGKIQFMNQSEARQDAIGELIANLLNEYQGTNASKVKEELMGMLIP
jgi:hypothetical protein